MGCISNLAEEKQQQDPKPPGKHFGLLSESFKGLLFVCLSTCITTISLEVSLLVVILGVLELVRDDSDDKDKGNSPRTLRRRV